jgi:hypothetical protein
MLALQPAVVGMASGLGTSNLHHESCPFWSTANGVRPTSHVLRGMASLCGATLQAGRHGFDGIIQIN